MIQHPDYCILIRVLSKRFKYFVNHKNSRLTTTRLCFCEFHGCTWLRPHDYYSLVSKASEENVPHTAFRPIHKPNNFNALHLKSNLFISFYVSAAFSNIVMLSTGIKIRFRFSSLDDKHNNIHY